MAAGLDNSIGDFILRLNIQTDSADLIPALWQKAQSGAQFVCGVRQGPTSWQCAAERSYLPHVTPYSAGSASR